MRCVHSLGDLLAVLVTLDALIADNDKLAVCWNHYLRMMDLVRKDSSRYGTSDATVEEMDKMLLHLKEVCLTACLLCFLPKMFSTFRQGYFPRRDIYFVHRTRLR